MRTVLTEDEHIKLNELGTEFCDELAKITAKALSQLPKAVEEVATYFLCDRTSLFSPYTFDRTREELARLRRRPECEHHDGFDIVTRCQTCGHIAEK